MRLGQLPGVVVLSLLAGLPIGAVREELRNPGPVAPAATEIAVPTTALAWVPKDALAVVRCPRLAHLGAFGETAFAQTLGAFDLDFGSTFASLQERVFAELPVGRKIWKVVSALEGEAVFALVRIYPAALLGRGQGGVPGSAVAYVEVGQQEKQVLELLESAGPTRDGTWKRTGPGRFSWVDEAFTVALQVEGGWLTVFAGPTGTDDGPAQWRALPVEASFLAADVAAGEPAAKAEKVYLEAFLNLVPVWSVAKMLAPAEAQGIIRSLKLDGIRGVSLVSSIDASARFHDRLTLHAPEHADVLSRVLAQPPLDPQWARHVARDAESATLVSFDFDATFGAVRSLLPRALARELDAATARAERETGLKLRRDVLTTFGPHFVLSMQGDPVSAMLANEAMEAALVVQVSDVEKARSLVDRLVSALGIERFREVHASPIAHASFTLPGTGLPGWLDPAYAFVDGALVVGTSPGAVKKVAGAVPKDGVHRVVHEALVSAGAGTWVYSRRSTAGEIKTLHSAFAAVADQLGSVGMGALDGFDLPPWSEIEKRVRDLPPSETTCRTAPEGVVLESRAVVPNLFIGAAPLAVVAAVAIPNLLSARTTANELAAIATLRNLNSAQAQFQATGAADRDGDGTGEFGSFGELSGGAALPGGEPLEPPMMSSAFREVEHGGVVRSGYHFRIYFVGADGAAIPENANGGAPSSVHPDTAERTFVAYAWPAEFGRTGRRAFVIDEGGDIFESSNDSRAQRYSGWERAPRPDAAFPKRGNLLERGEGPLRLGQDAAFWTVLK